MYPAPGALIVSLMGAWSSLLVILPSRSNCLTLSTVTGPSRLTEDMTRKKCPCKWKGWFMMSYLPKRQFFTTFCLTNDYLYASILEVFFFYLRQRKLTQRRCLVWLVKREYRSTFQLYTLDLVVSRSNCTTCAVWSCSAVTATETIAVANLCG